MREKTLRAHLDLTEDALRQERMRIADQLEFIRRLRSEGRSVSTAKELLNAMNDNLCVLERHRKRLIEQLDLFVPPPLAPHADRQPRRD